MEYLPLEKLGGILLVPSWHGDSSKSVQMRALWEGVGFLSVTASLKVFLVTVSEYCSAMLEFL